jgi:hypothetical protein
MKKNDGREVEQAAVDEESDIAAQGGRPQRHHLLHIKGQKHKKRSNVADTIHCAHGNPPELLRAWPAAGEDQARSVQEVERGMIATRGLRARHPIGRRMSLCSSLFCPGRSVAVVLGADHVEAPVIQDQAMSSPRLRQHSSSNVQANKSVHSPLEVASPNFCAAHHPMR